MRRPQENVQLFCALLFALCLQTGGQPCQICAPDAETTSCETFAPPEGVTVDGSMCTTIEYKYPDYHKKLCEKYPPPKGYVYGCTTPGSTNTFSCRSSCGPPLEEVGNLKLDLLQGGGLLANFNSRPRPRGAGLFDFSTFSADKSRGNPNFGRFATLAGLNGNSNNFNNDNNNFNNFNNNNFNMFRNNRVNNNNNNINNKFNFFNKPAGPLRNRNLQSQVLTQPASTPISGGISPSRSPPRAENPRSSGSTLLDIAPQNEDLSKQQQTGYTTPPPPDQSRPLAPLPDQPPPIGTLVTEDDGDAPSVSSHPDQGVSHPSSLTNDGQSSSDATTRESDPEVEEEAHPSASDSSADSHIEGKGGVVGGAPVESYPKEEENTQADLQDDRDPGTVNGATRLPTSREDSPASSSPSEDYLKNVRRYSQQGVSRLPGDETQESNPPETLDNETPPSDDSVSPRQDSPLTDGAEENEDFPAGGEIQGENPSEPPHSSDPAEVTSSDDVESDNAYRGHQSLLPPEQYTNAAEYAGGQPDLPPPPPQTYPEDQSLSADASSGSSEHSQPLQDARRKLYPEGSSPDVQDTVPETLVQDTSRVSPDQPPPSSSRDNSVPSDSNGFPYNPEPPSYPDPQPPENYPDLKSDLTEGEGQESGSHADVPSLPSADSKAASPPGIFDVPSDAITSGKGDDPADTPSAPSTYPTSSSNGDNNYNSNYDDDAAADDTTTTTNYNDNQQREASQNLPRSKLSSQYDNDDDDDAVSRDSSDDHDHGNLPPESFQNPFKNPSSPYRKRADQFESNPAFVGTSLFSEGFLDSPDRIHPVVVASKPRDPDAVDVGANEIFPGFDQFEKTGTHEVLDIANSPRRIPNGQQRDIFTMFGQPTVVNQPTGRGLAPSPQVFGFRAQNPPRNLRQNPGVGGFQMFSAGSGQDGSKSAGAVFGGDFRQGGQNGRYSAGGGRGASNPSAAFGTLPTARTHPAPSPHLPPPSFPHPEAAGQRGGLKPAGTRSDGVATRLPGGSSGFDSGHGFNGRGSGTVGLPDASDSPRADGGGRAGSFSRAGVRRGFGGFGSPGTRDDFGFPGSFGRFNDGGFGGNNVNNFKDEHLSEDMFKNAQTTVTDTGAEQPLASASDGR